MKKMMFFTGLFMISIFLISVIAYQLSINFSISTLYEFIPVIVLGFIFMILGAIGKKNKE